MELTWCKTCGKPDWGDGKHKCPPIFYFKHPDWGDEFQKIRAWDFEEAARKFAARYNEDGDYALMNNFEEVIISDGATEKKFEVTAEPDIHYSVKEID